MSPGVADSLVCSQQGSGKQRPCDLGCNRESRGQRDQFKGESLGCSDQS